MTIILNPLKETPDNFGSESKTCFSLKFVLSGMRQRCRVRQDDDKSFDKSKPCRQEFFCSKEQEQAVMDLSAGQNQVQKLHSFVEQKVDFGGLAVAS